MTTANSEPITVIEAVITPDGQRHKYKRDEMEAAIRGELFRREMARWYLVQSLRGRSLDEVIEAWWQANGWQS